MSDPVFTPPLVTELRDGAAMPGAWDWADTMLEAAAEIMRLRERLEIGYAFDAEGNRIASEHVEHYDGIVCRDETIKGLDEQLKECRDAIPDTPDFDWLAGKTLPECIEALVKRVPIPSEPTMDMVIAGFECEAFEALDALYRKPGDGPGRGPSCKDAADAVRGIYAAMIAAAPQVAPHLVVFEPGPITNMDDK